MAFESLDWARPSSQNQANEAALRLGSEAYNHAIQGLASLTGAASGAAASEALRAPLSQPLTETGRAMVRNFRGVGLGVVANQVLEQTVWKDQPESGRTQLTDILAPVVAGFIPGRALLKGGFVVAAHIGSRVLEPSDKK